MKRIMVRFNILQLGFIVAAGIKIQKDWHAERKKVDQIHNAPMKPPQILAPIIPPPPSPVNLASYSEIARKTLFSRDRNPDVAFVVTRPPSPLMPPLPTLHGVVSLPSGVFALMTANENATSKVVRVGEKIGDFELRALSDAQISLKWIDQTVTKDVREMMHQARDLKEPSTSPPPVLQSRAVGQTFVPEATINGRSGVDAGHRIKSCLSDDTSPTGTVAGGYKKVSIVGEFGKKCEWQPVQ